MHFPIIQLLERPYNPEEDDIEMDSSIYGESYTIQCETDFVGEQYDEEKRSSYLHSDELKSLFQGLADVDVETGEITFHDRDIVNDTLNQEYKKSIEFLTRCLNNKTLDFTVFNRESTYFRGQKVLVSQNGYVELFTTFLSYGIFSSKKLYIGAIYDAHC